jgi:TolB-like protein/Tfp pilus assembly protein PilF
MLHHQKLFADLKRRGVFRASAIYGAAAFVVIQAADFLLPALQFPESAATVVAVVTIMGFPISMVVAWVFDFTPIGVTRTSPPGEGELEEIVTQPPHRRWPSGILALAGVGILFGSSAWALGGQGGGAAGWALGERAAGRSIAVLRCENFSSDPGDVHLASGLHDQVLVQLQRISSLFSIGRESMEWYKRNPVPPTQIARELGVAYIGQCSVQKDGNRIRMTFQLLEGNTGQQIWAGNYDESLTTHSLFDIQSDIAEQVAGAIGAVITPKERARIELPPTGDLEAYDLYLLGRHRWTTRSSETILEAIGYFERAIEKDPTFSLAYTGLADAYMVLPFYDLDTDPMDTYEPAKNAASRAVELDPLSGEAHASLGFICHLYEWDWAGAEEHLSAAVHLAPGYAPGHQWYSNLLGSLGRHTQAVAEAEVALSFDPISNVLVWTMAERLAGAGLTDEARIYYEQNLQMDPPISWALQEYATNLLTSAPENPIKAVQLFGRFVSLFGYPAPDRMATVADAIQGNIDAREDAVAILTDVVERTALRRADLIGWYATFAPPDVFFALLDEGVSLRRFWVPFAPIDIHRANAAQTQEILDDPRWEQFLQEIAYPGS